MEPKRPVSKDTLAAMQKLFGALMKERFEKAGESRLWTLYCRRSDNASGN